VLALARRAAIAVPFVLAGMLPAPVNAQFSEASQATQPPQPSQLSQEGTPQRRVDLVDGYVSVGADYLPNVGDTLELRARLFVERQVDAGPNVRFSFSGWAEGLVADRADSFRPSLSDGSRSGSRTVRDAVARPHEAYVDLRAGSIDLRAGLSNVVWGRLDELPPGDVINPLDISRFLFEGRNAARLPVPLVRARWVGGEALTVEGIWVPLFRRGRFDFLDENSSPFNLLTDRDLCRRDAPCPPIPLEISLDRHEPARTLGNSQGGARVIATTGRVDWSVSGYRGFEPFGVVTIDPRPGPPSPLRLFETYPRFTMIAGDVETVRGSWAIRGEAAAFVDRTFQPVDASAGGSARLGPGGGVYEGHAIEAGGSVERKAGDYRINLAVLMERQAGDAAGSVDGDAFAQTDVSLIMGAQRSFTRDTRRVLLFGLWNMADRSGFLRSIGSWSLRDNLWLEGSVGWFLGEGTDTLSRFATRDFAYLKLKAYF
jgi:hypothetical protein